MYGPEGFQMSSSASRNYFSTSDSEVNGLKRLLENASIQKSEEEKKDILRRVIAGMTLGIDMSPLFTEMIKAGATNDLVQKKLVYLYICNYAESNAALALLTVNTLRKDTQDRSAVVRGLALRSMCSLRLPDLLEYIEQPLLAGLKDISSYVRRVAVMGCVKLFFLNPDFITDNNLISTLYAMLKDSDAQVVCNCISALDEILAAQGGLTVDQNLVHDLLKRMKTFSEWGQSQILQLLLRYTPADEEELFALLNIVDDRLEHSSGAVTMACVAAFLHLTSNFEQLQDDVYKRVKDPLLSMLSSNNTELSYTCLCHIELLLTRRPQLFEDKHRTFFSRHNDPQYVQRKKMQILASIATESNIEEIVTELSAKVHDVDVEMSRESIKTIGQIAMALPPVAEYCVDKLLSFLAWELEYITAAAMMVIRDLLLKFEKSAIAVLPQLGDCLQLVQDPKGVAAIVWMIGEYGQLIPDSPYLLEPLVDNIGEEHSSEVKLQLLTALLKLFFKKPPECQEMLGRLLQYCVDEETDIDVHDRALLYYRLLNTGVDKAQKVVCSSRNYPVQDFKSSSDSKRMQEDQLFLEFNTLSVMYKKPSRAFISQMVPYIKGRPYTEVDSDEDTTEDTVNYMQEKAPLYSPESKLDVVVADLLGENVLTEEASFGEARLELNQQPALTSAEFAKKWETLPPSAQFEVVLKQVPSSSTELQQTLSRGHISMMASLVTPNQPTQKYYFYAQEVLSSSYFLVEAIVKVPEKTLKAVIKAETAASADDFVQVFKSSLIGAWTDSP